MGDERLRGLRSDLLSVYLPGYAAFGLLDTHFRFVLRTAVLKPNLPYPVTAHYI